VRTSILERRLPQWNRQPALCFSQLLPLTTRTLSRPLAH
jgi:hypothetical protein